MRFRYALPIVAVLACLGCGDPDKPKMCSYTEAMLKGAAPGDAGCPDGEKPQCASVTPGELLYVRHELPENVDPPGPVRITVKSVCRETVTEVSHVDSVALLPMVAPPGSDCLLSITATIANSELRCDSSGTTCSLVDAGCQVADSGAAD